MGQKDVLRLEKNKKAMDELMNESWKAQDKLNEKRTFTNLGEALLFLAEEQKELEEKTRLFHLHVGELLKQLVEELDKARAKRKPRRG